MSSEQFGGPGPVARMRLVIDASVAIEISLSGGALASLEGHELVAPPLIRSASLSVLHELVRRGDIPRQHAQEALANLRQVPVTVIDDPAHDQRAWEIAEALGWARTYDAEYLALALHERVPLVTLDARLQRGAGRIVEILGPRDVPAA